MMILAFCGTGWSRIVVRERCRDDAIIRHGSQLLECSIVTHLWIITGTVMRQ
jgi:hypothetical protein